MIRETIFGRHAVVDGWNRIITLRVVDYSAQAMLES